MSDKYSVGQMNQLGDGLEAADFTVDDVTKLRNPTVLRQVKLYLLASIVQAYFKLALDKVFNPVEFLGEGWKIDEQDEREDALTIIDFEQIILETNLQDDETVVNGEEKLRRLKDGKNIRLGAKSFLALWEDWKLNKQNSVLEKLLKSKNVTHIYFFGTILRDPDGRRYALYLYFNGSDWSWYYDWLDDHWGSCAPSVSLASVN